MSSRQADQVRVAVTAEYSLIGEAVRTALGGRGFEAVSIRWPGTAVPSARTGVRRSAHDVGLLVCDLDRWSRLRAAALVVQGLRTRWVVLTGAPEGPLWGAMYQAGAAAVISSGTSLDEVAATLVRVAVGEPVVDPADRERLRLAWERLQRERKELQARAQLLTSREREVLLLLYDGQPIARIAVLLGVASSTVRSQVKSILRKLGVNSQLAAVAAYGTLADTVGTDAPVRS